MKLICVRCREVKAVKDIRGSMRKPYCIKCFNIVWNNDIEEYAKYEMV